MRRLGEIVSAESHARNMERAPARWGPSSGPTTSREQDPGTVGILLRGLFCYSTLALSLAQKLEAINLVFDDGPETLRDSVLGGHHL